MRTLDLSDNQLLAKILLELEKQSRLLEQILREVTHRNAT